MDVVILFLIGIVIFLIGFIWLNSDEKRFYRDKRKEEKDKREKEKVEEFIDKIKGDNEFYDWLIPKIENVGRLEGENYQLEEGASDKEKESLAKYQKEVDGKTEKLTNDLKKTQDENETKIKEAGWKKEFLERGAKHPAKMTEDIGIILSFLSVIIGVLQLLKK